MGIREHYIDLYRSFYANGGYGDGPHHQVLHARSSIRRALEVTGSTSMLDYGCGDGLQYTVYGLREFFPIEELFCYDPGVLEFSDKPEASKTFDAVISTDVMEHIPDEVTEEVLAEIFAYATKMVYFRIATSRAINMLPNGENAHCNIKSHIEWLQLVQKYRSGQYVVVETTGVDEGTTILQ